MQDYPLNLKSGVWQPVQVSGDYFQVIEATGVIFLKFNDGAPIRRHVAMGMPVRTYTRCAVMSEADQQVVIALGFTGGASAPLDGRATMTGDINVTMNKPTLRPTMPDVSVPAGDVVQVALDDPDRLSLLVQLPENADGPVRVGDASVGAARGVILYPGDAVSLDGGPAAYVHNPNATAITVALIAERAP